MKKTGSKYLLCFLVVWVVQMILSVYFCTQKAGFHEDEYYTYYSTARTNGFYVEDGQWMDREAYEKEFVVLPDQRFQYGLVKLVQSWDVHPPMYYWIFHTVASFVPNVFSKWTGLSVNLFFHGINIILLSYLSCLIGGRDGKLALFVVSFWGFGPAVMSGVVFIRMYEMLAAFVLLCAILHVRVAGENGDKGSAALPVWGFLMPMMAVTYIGFLTHYYYFIFLFYLAAAFCVWLLWRDRNIWNCLKYAVSQGTALALAVATYPSCLGQMFRGQRGAQATESFFDVSNTVGRIRFFGDLMDQYVFGRWFPVLLLVVAFFAVMAKRGAGKKSGLSAGYLMLLCAGTGYFLTVSKTALLLGETSNRYQLPVYGIIVLLVFAAVKEFLGDAGAARTVPWGRYAEGCAALACLLVCLLGAWRGKVVFLYPEDREQTAFARECAGKDIPAVYVYQTGEEWCVWAVTDELLAYPQVYFAAAGSEGAVSEERIRNAKSMVVYLANGADEEKDLQRILDGATALADCQRERVFEEEYCSVYYLHGEQ